MGLSSSQARLLNLTSRMHQIEYKAAKLEAEKLQMANESDRVYNEYLDALDKTKIQRKQLTTDGSVTYVDMASYSEFKNAGFALVSNNITYANLKKNGSTFYQVTPLKAPTGADELAAFQQAHPSLASISAGGDYYIRVNASNPNDPSNPAYCSGVVPTTWTNATDTEMWELLLTNLGVDVPYSNDFETVLTNVIQSGEVTIVAKSEDNGFYTPYNEEFHLYETSVSTNTNLQEVKDEVNLKKAEAKYEADMLKIDRKDRKYDSDLAALDNERNAIKNEMETLKNVAKENVDRTYKLFS